MKKYEFSQEAYFAVRIDQVVPGRARSFPLFIYLPRNNHLILRYFAEQDVVAAQLEGYRKSGLTEFWIPKEFEADWKRYLAGEAPASAQAPAAAEGSRTQANDPAAADATRESGSASGEREKSTQEQAKAAAVAARPAKAEAQATETFEAAKRKEDRATAEPGTERKAASAKQSAEAREAAEAAEAARAAAEAVAAAAAADPATDERARKVVDLIEHAASPAATEKERQRAIDKIGREVSDLMGALATATGKDAEEVLERCRRTSEQIVRVAARGHKMGSLCEDVKMIKALGTPHSATVSTFAVLFGAGLGFTDPETLADLSVAALLHDVGFVAVNPLLLMSPEDKLSPGQRAEFLSHVDSGIAILDERGIEMTENVRIIIEQHHERFDGSGHPGRVRGPELNDLAQLVAVADLLDDLMTGRLDGLTRSPGQAMTQLRQMQNAGAEPLFEPGLFECLMELLGAPTFGEKPPEVFKDVG